MEPIEAKDEQVKKDETATARNTPWVPWSCPGYETRLNENGHREVRPTETPSEPAPTIAESAANRVDIASVLATALEIAVEDISEMDKGARYKTSNYIAAAKRRIAEAPHEL